MSHFLQLFKFALILNIQNVYIYNIINLFITFYYIDLLY